MISRNRKLNEFSAWCALTEKEQEWISQKKFDGLVAAMLQCGRSKKDGGCAANKNRIKIIQDRAKLLINPTSSEEDEPNWIAWNEIKLLGCAITCSPIDSCDTSSVNCTCKEFLSGRKGFIVLGVVIESVREIKIKNGDNAGKKMAFLSVSDGTCTLSDVCVFSKTYEEFGDLLIENNTVLLQGKRDTIKDSFVVEKIWQI